MTRSSMDTDTLTPPPGWGRLHHGRHRDVTLPGRARAKRLDAGKRHPSLVGYSPRHAA